MPYLWVIRSFGGFVITLVWRTDIHLADTSPQSRTDDWTTTILGKIQQVGSIARAEKAAAVLDGGDFFHIKSPGRNSHELVLKAAEAHLAYSCPVYGNVGNHDVKYGNMEFLPESPLGVLFASGVFKRLYDEHEAVFEQGGVKVRVVGIPYHGTKYDMNRFTSISKGDEDYLVVIAHCLASQAGGTMFEAEDIVRYSDLVNSDADVFCFGHWHKDQGITEIAKGKTVINIGSMSRGSISQDDLERTPSCVVMKFTAGAAHFEKVPLRVAPPSEVFNLAGRTRMIERQNTMNDVVDRLKGALDMRTEGSILDLVREAHSVPDPIKERTLMYLEKAGAR